MAYVTRNNRLVLESPAALPDVSTIEGARAAYAYVRELAAIVLKRLPERYDDADSFQIADAVEHSRDMARFSRALLKEIEE